MKTNADILEAVLKDIENGNFKKYEDERRAIQRKLTNATYLNSEAYRVNELAKAKLLFYINSIYIDMELLNEPTLKADARRHIEKDASKYINYLIKAADTGEIKKIEYLI